VLIGAALEIRRAAALLGDFAQALILAERALILQRRVNEPPERIGRTLELLAWAHLSVEDWPDAIRVGRKATATFFKARSSALVETCVNLPIALRESGELDEANALGEVLLETTRAVESRSYMQADVLNHLGRTWRAWGGAKKASALFKEAIALTKSGRELAAYPPAPPGVGFELDGRSGRGHRAGAESCRRAPPAAAPRGTARLA
jgi:tetratricopeptide (TPR) repeat protein